MPPNTQQPQNNNYSGYYNNPGQNQNMTQQVPGQNTPKKSKTSLIIIVLLVIFLIVVFSFAVWAFTEMSKYKNDTEKITAKAVEIAKQETATEKDKEFVNKEKNPYKQYKSSDILGAVSFNYPKTWSAYVVEDQGASSQTPIDGYLHPNFVPGKDSGTAFGLRVQELNTKYSDLLSQYDGKVKQGKVKIQPFSPPKVPSVLGVRITGEINKGQQSTLVMLPLRDKTIIISTESPQFVSDFDNIVMSSLTFSP